VPLKALFGLAEIDRKEGRGFDSWGWGAFGDFGKQTQTLST
jgi:hypothetical protein